MGVHTGDENYAIWLFQLSVFGVVICLTASLSARTLCWICYSCELSLHILKGDIIRKDLICLVKMPFCFKDDVVMGTLTVRENLQFSAALRLPTTMASHEKNERISKVIQQLGLDKVADSKVMWTNQTGS